MKKHVFKLIFSIVLSASLAGPAFSGYFEQGSGYYTRRNYEKAKEMFLKAVEVSEDGNAYYFLGEIEKNEKNFDKAIEYYQLAINSKITRKYQNLAYWNIIILIEQKGNYIEMVKVCKELYDKLGDSGAKSKVESLINKYLWTENQEAKDEYKRGLELKNSKDPKEAEEAFKNAIKMESSFLAPKFEMGILQLKKGDTRDAIYYLSEISDKIPFYGEVHLLLGDIYFQKDSFRDAIPHFEMALEFGFLDNNSRYIIHIKNATAYYNTRDYKKAKENLDEAVKLNQKSLEPLFLLSAINIKEENYDEALKSLEKAQKIDPDNPEILFQIGSIHFKMNNPKFALYFDKLFESAASSGNEVPQKYFKAFSLLAKYQYEKSNYAKVEKIFENLPEKYSDQELNLIYARSEYFLENFDKSLKIFEKIYLSSDDDKYMLCIIYAKTGMNAKAKSILYNLWDRGGFLEKARKEPALALSVKEIEDEKNKPIEIKNQPNQ